MGRPRRGGGRFLGMRTGKPDEIVIFLIALWVLVPLLVEWLGIT